MKYDAEIKLQKVTNQAMDERMDLNKRNALLVQEMELTKINYENQAEERKRNYEKNI